jgi:hypothetical protein
MSEQKKPQEFTDVIQPPDKVEDNKVNEDNVLKNLEKDVEKRYVEIVKANARKEEFPISGKIWKRRKITHKEHKELVRIRRELQKLDRQKDEELYESKYEEFYRKFAYYSLIDKETNAQMSDDDFDNAEAGEVNRIVDGINYRITYGLPSVA